MKGYEAIAKISEIKAILSDAEKSKWRISEDCVCFSLETILKLARYTQIIQDYVIRNEVEKDKIYE